MIESSPYYSGLAAVPSTSSESAVRSRAARLLEENRQRVWQRTDRMFVWLMLFEWLAGIIFAVVFSPRTWAGATSSIHPHVWTAIFFGGAITFVPMLLAYYRSGEASTRQVVAVGQTLMSGLLIHLMNGRIEAHFQIFGSLAFLAFYRDWRVLATATILTAADHFLRGVYLPMSIFGVANPNPWRWLEHACYVVFEVFFLILAIRTSLDESARDAGRKAALEEVKENVEREVANRTSELTAEIAERRRIETELAAARDSALEAARSKSQFLANMSHEIRTPMNGVMGMTSLLLDTRLDRDQREFAATIRESGDLLLTIINDILDFSKIEAGKLSFESLDFDLREVVESTLEMLSERAQSKGLELLAHVPREVFTALRGDAGRLRQILTNLLNNAIKFTAHGEVVLRVMEQDDGLVRFEVQDTGIGISAEAQRHLFKPFNQADGSTTRKYGGTGLGLAIARQLVEMMDGQIGVNSAPDKGSTFWFSARFERQLSVPAVREHDDLAGLHVLIVDDNATNRQILGLQLGSLRMRCATATNGREALTLLKREAQVGNPFDAAILDMQMPEMDGLMLGARIKADKTVAATKLIMLSSLGKHLELDQLRDSGIEEYLVKPIKQSRLYDCLADVMSQVERRSPKPEAPAGALTLSSPEAQAVRILLAEDNMINQKVALRQLQKLGYNADAVANGQEVLEAMQRISYDIILMDCQMPELDGYEATGAIRQREGGRRHAWIIAMTANAMSGDRELCLAAGMDDYVSKPIRTGELGAVLERAKTRCRTRAENLVSIDVARLSTLRALPGDESADLLTELVNLFATTGPSLIAEMRATLAAGDGRALGRAAHSFKGSSAQFGAHRLDEFCGQLEMAGRNGELQGVAEIITAAEREYHVVLAALEAEIHLPVS